MDKIFTVDIFENTGHNVTGEIMQLEFNSREEALKYCSENTAPAGHRFVIGEWKNGKLIELSDYN